MNLLGQVGGAAELGRLQTVDWIVIVCFILFSLGIGLFLSRRAQSSTEAYFKGGGNMGWLLLGTSMIATAFAADTPLALAGWVVTKGLSQNWFWWSMVPVTMLGVFFFAPLWKRANPLTDMEFVYQRYSGNPANALRIGKALWLAFPFGCMNMGWVNKAMTVIINYVVPDFPRLPGVDSLVLAVFIWTPLSDGVHPDVRSAVRSGQLDAVEIGYDHGILRYPSFWAAYGEGAYDAYTDGEGVSHPDRHAEALEALGLEDRVELDSIDSIAGVPDDFRLRTEQGNGAGADAAVVLHEIYRVCAGVNTYKVLFLLFLIVVAYTSISGLWGVVVTDFIQFWVAMIGCVILAVMAVNRVGGLENLFAQMAELYGTGKAGAMMSLFPVANAGEYGLFTSAEFILLILVFWWSFAFTDGGSFFAQRMLSAKDERNAALGYLWYGVAHYALRMWPWLLVGFVAAVLFPYQPYPNGALPSGQVAEAGYVKVMLSILPPGLLGILVAALFAAYMSTISTWINLGASYVMNDVYRPFVAPGIERRIRRKTGRADFRLPDRHFVRAGILATLAIALCGIVVSLFLDTISGAWFLLAGFNGGIGVIYLLRWYWWRINAWSELVCLVSLLFISLGMWAFGGALEGIDTVLFAGTAMAFPVAGLFSFPYNLLITVPLSVGLALAATFLTRPTDPEQLKTFHRTVQAGGPGWRRIDRQVRAESPGFTARSPLNQANFMNWILASATVFFWLVGLGKVIIGDSLYRDAGVSGENAIFCSFILGLAIVAAAGRWRRSLRDISSLLIVAVVTGVGYALLPVGAPTDSGGVARFLANRPVGLLMLLAGLGLGIAVARSFAPSRWKQ